MIIGPGSLFTSILPNFLVPGVLRAVAESRVRVVYISNVANQRGETHGMDCVAHVSALLDHGLAGVVDTVIVHDTDRFPPPANAGVPHVACGTADHERLVSLGVEVIAADLLDPADPLHHDPARLAAVLPGVIA